MKSKVKTTKRSYLSKDDLGLSEIWLWGVFIIFPLIYNKHYFDILETKFATFTVLSLGLIVLFSLYKLMSFFGKEGSGKVSFIDLLKNNFDIIDMGMLVFILVSVISTLAAAPYVNEAFWGNEGRHTGLFLLLLYVICFFIVSRYLEFKPHFINAFLIVGFLICLFGITDYFGMDILDFKEKMRDDQLLIFTSTIGNINTYTTFVGFVVSLSATLYTLGDDQKKEDLIRSLKYFVCMAVGFAALIMGRSDNGYLTAIMLFMCLPLLSLSSIDRLRRYFTILATYMTVIKIIQLLEAVRPDKLNGIDGLFVHIAGLPFLNFIVFGLWALVAVIFTFEYRKTRIEKVSVKIASAKLLTIVWSVFIIVSSMVGLFVVYKVNTGELAINNPIISYLKFDDYWGTFRGYVWRACLEEYSQLSFIHKIFGTGPDTFGIYMVTDLARQNDMYMTTGQIFDSAHNEYLQYLFTVGPIGLIAYLTALLSTVYALIKKGINNKYMLAVAMLIMCYMAQAVVNINLPISTPIFWAFLMIAKAMLRKDNTNQK